jgi:hypothetical protein
MFYMVDNSMRSLCLRMFQLGTLRILYPVYDYTDELCMFQRGKHCTIHIWNVVQRDMLWQSSLHCLHCFVLLCAMSKWIALTFTPSVVRNVTRNSFDRIMWTFVTIIAGVSVTHNCRIVNALLARLTHGVVSCIARKDDTYIKVLC